MFKGFNLENMTDDMFSTYKESGERVFTKLKDEVGKELKEFISIDGSIDGTKMQDNWFPKVEADIFLSHSHADRDKALALAGWLQNEFGLKVFIDSCVWGFANDLLKQIDDEYCMNDKKTSYIYEIRNYSTSHVHTMLTTALVKMIDSTECLLFLNTPKSIATKDIASQTLSPWIYMEIAMSKIVEEKKPERKGLIKKGHFEKNQGYKPFEVKYKMDMEHLKYIDINNLRSWLYSHRKINTLRPLRDDPSWIIHPLDILYMQYNIAYTDEGSVSTY
jgi:hypothetical protein